MLDIFSVIIYFLIMSFLAYIALLLAYFVIPFMQNWFPFLEDKLILVKPAIWGIGIALTAPHIVKNNQDRNLIYQCNGNF